MRRWRHAKVRNGEGVGKWRREEVERRSGGHVREWRCEEGRRWRVEEVER